MSTGQSAPRGDGPEQRWRRTVERRGRPAKLKLGRLVRDFGYGELDREAGETIEARLANVGLAVDPRLNAVGVDDVVTLYAPEDRRSTKEPATELRRVLGEGTDDGEAGVPNVEVVADEGEAMDEVQGGDASHDRVADSEAPSSVSKVAPVDRPATSGTRAHGGLFSLGSGSRGRWRGSCAVCAQAPESGRRGDLLDAGWALEADMSVCPLCRQAGWQSRPGGGAPFRPFSARPPGS